MEYGYFDDEKREYVITDRKTKRLWYNYLWNEETICVCDQFGFGNVWSIYDGNRRMIESGERNVYIKDKDLGISYSANRNYDDLPFDGYKTHVGLGYQKIESEYNGIKTELTFLVPTEGKVMCYRIKVGNTSEKTRNFNLYFCLNPQPAISPHDAYGTGDYDKIFGGFIYSHVGYNLTSKYPYLFVACDKACDAYETSEVRFKGVYNGFDKPVGLKNGLSSKGNDFVGVYVSVFEFDLSLSGGEEREFYFCSAIEKSVKDAVLDKNRCLSKEYFESELNKQCAYNKKTIDVFTAQSPDEYLNSQANIWLKRQVSLGKTWGRIYGKGYRDVMQDITAFVSFDPELAKKRILYALSYQYEDGNPIRMFEPNFHYPYNDGASWIPATVLSYLNESGDVSVLDEEVPYLKGDSYESARYEDAFYEETYEAGKRKDSVLCHILAGVDYLLACRGKNNLVKWRGGDWNDSMNNVGTKNIGESVWLSIATVKAVNELKEILKIAGHSNEEIEEYERKKQELIHAIERVGTLDDRYIYGINDFGEVIGGKERLFLNPQTWAVLAKIASRERLEKVMDSVEENLKCDFGYTQCAPSFTKGTDRIGRVSYFKKGLVENGAVYNHGVAFKIVADCMLSRGDNAYNSLKMISYDNPKNPENGVEPYAVSNMYIGPENEFNAGFAPMSWITGTAGWLYRCIGEYIFGIKATFEGLKIEPCFPSVWKKVKASRKFRGETYEITYIRSDKNEVVCDGKTVSVLPLSGKGKKHEVICYFHA